MAFVFVHHLPQDALRIFLQHPLCQPLERCGGGVSLPAALAPAGAWLAVIFNAHVPHFAGHAVGTVVYLSVVYDAAADTGAQRDGHKPLAAAACAGVVFAHGRAVAVVFQVKGLVHILVKQTAQGHTAKRQVAAILQRAGAYLHHAGNAHTYGKNLVHAHAGLSGQLLRHAG